MKKIKIIFRIIGIVTAVCIFLLFLYVCYSMMRYEKHFPYLQPNSKWESTDKHISFTAKEGIRGRVYGTMQFNDEVIDIIIVIYLDGRSAVCYDQNGKPGDEILVWWSTYRYKNKFTAKVREANACYSVGDKIKFRCIEGRK